MREKLKAVIKFAIAGFLTYFLLPYLIFFFLGIFDIIVVTPSFVMALIIVGLMGASLVAAQHYYPKGTISFHYFAIATTIYLGIYMLYVFGGLSIDRTFGEYAVNIPEGLIYVGLQVPAWLLLIASIIRTVFHVIKVIEIKKGKELIPKLRDREKFKPVTKLGNLVIENLYMVVNLVTISFIITILVNGSYVTIFGNVAFDYDWENGGTPTDPNDDLITISLIFDMENQGFFPLEELRGDLSIFTLNTSDTSQLLLPANTKIAELNNVFLERFPAYSSLANRSLPIQIGPTFSPGLANFSAILEFRFYLRFFYAGVNVKGFLIKQFIWVKLIP